MQHSSASHLPQSFQVNSDATVIANVTVIRAIDHIDLALLPCQGINVDKDTAIPIFLEDSVHRVLGAMGGTYWAVKMQSQMVDSKCESALLVHILDNQYIIVQQEGFDIDNILGSCHSTCTVTSILYPGLITKAYVSCSPRLADLSTITCFDMSPPIPGFHVEDASTALLNSTDPHVFLKHRYYDALYSLRTPLGYFTNSTFARFRLLCNQSGIAVSLILDREVLQLYEFDCRHAGNFGLFSLQLFGNGNFADSNNMVGSLENHVESCRLKTMVITKLLAIHSPTIPHVEHHRSKDPESYFLAAFAHENQKVLNYMTQYHSDEEFRFSSDPKEASINSDQLQHFVLKLKIREAQLQVLLCLELIAAWGINEQTFLASAASESSPQLQWKATTRLVRKKKKANVKRTAPTLVTLAFCEANQLRSVADTNTVYKLVNAYIDRMALWDTLLPKDGSHTQSYSNVFFVHIVVPFYGKRLPLITKHMVGEYKLLNVKVVSLAGGGKESRKSRGKNKKMRDGCSGTLPYMVNNLGVDVISNSMEPEPISGIMRSKSNLSSRNFEKRQVDMGFSVRSISEAKLLVERQSPSTDLPRQIFKTQRKRKEMSIFMQGRQVEATPIKQKSGNALQNSIPIVETPNLPRSYSMPIHATTAVDEIPDKARNNVHAVGNNISTQNSNKVTLEKSTIARSPSNISNANSQILLTPFTRRRLSFGAAMASNTIPETPRHSSERKNLSSAKSPSPVIKSSPFVAPSPSKRSTGSSMSSPFSVVPATPIPLLPENAPSVKRARKGPTLGPQKVESCVLNSMDGYLSTLLQNEYHGTLSTSKSLNIKTQNHASKRKDKKTIQGLTKPDFSPLIHSRDKLTPKDPTLFGTLPVSDQFSVHTVPFAQENYAHKNKLTKMVKPKPSPLLPSTETSIAENGFGFESRNEEQSHINSGKDGQLSKQNEPNSENIGGQSDRGSDNDLNSDFDSDFERLVRSSQRGKTSRTYSKKNSFKKA